MSSDDYVFILHTLPEFAKRAPSRCLYRRRSVLERSAGAERRGTTIVLHSSLLQRCVAACLPPERGLAPGTGAPRVQSRRRFWSQRGGWLRTQRVSHDVRPDSSRSTRVLRSTNARSRETIRLSSSAYESLIIARSSEKSVLVWA